MGLQAMPSRNGVRRPTVIDLDDHRAKEAARSRVVVNRRRDRLRPTELRLDLAEYEDSAVVIALDPGGTTGWSMFEVSPEGLSDLPENRGIGVLNNVLSWKHGQIDCGATKGDRGRSDYGDRGGRGGGLSAYSVPLGSGDAGDGDNDPGYEDVKTLVNAMDDVSALGESAGLGEILGLIRNWPQATIVIEDFILDPKRFNTGRDLLSPVRLTSGVTFDLWLQKRKFFMQSASLAKSTAGDQQLKNWNLYEAVGGLRHARDADRHAVTFLKRAAAVSPGGMALRMKAWPHLFGEGAPFYNDGRGEVFPRSAAACAASGVDGPVVPGSIRVTSVAAEK